MAPAIPVSGVSAAAVAENDGEDAGRSLRSLRAAPLRLAHRPSGVPAGKRDGVIGKVTWARGRRGWDPARSARGCVEVGWEDWPVDPRLGRGAGRAPPWRCARSLADWVGVVLAVAAAERVPSAWLRVAGCFITRIATRLP